MLVRFNIIAGTVVTGLRSCDGGEAAGSTDSAVCHVVLPAEGPILLFITYRGVACGNCSPQTRP